MCGLVPERDIPIRFVGLRPGEKLYEELVGEGEVAVGSTLDKILQIRPMTPPDFEGFKDDLSALEAASYGDEATVAIGRLKALIPTFRCCSDSVSAVTPVALSTGASSTKK